MVATALLAPRSDERARQQRAIDWTFVAPRRARWKAALAVWPRAERWIAMHRLCTRCENAVKKTIPTDHSLSRAESTSAP